VELAADGADEIDQPLFDIHVNIFQFDLRLEFPLLELLEDFPESGDDFLRFRRLQDFAFLQGFAVRNTPLNIVGV